MKNILAIEIKDNKTVVTLTKNINGKHNLLLHKTYGSKPLASNVMYDITIIEQIKADLLRNNLLELVNETYLSINTKRTFVQTFELEVQYNASVEDKKEELIESLERKYPQLKVLELHFSDTEASLTKKNITATAELVEIDFLEEIESQFNLKGIKIDKVVPIIRAIENSTKEDAIKNGFTFNVLVEEKFTQLTILNNGTLNSSIKWNTGLSDIYEYISSKMNIDKASAKKLFKSFGSIPPEEVIDNKVIHSRKHGKELEIFTKKDLSKFITEQVNELFANIKSKVDPIKEVTDIKIIFNGEIKSLTGFKKYASKSFAEPNIQKYNSRIIGLNEENEFITIGLLSEAKKNQEQEAPAKVELLTPKINILSKLVRMYNYI